MNRTGLKSKFKQFKSNKNVWIEIMDEDTLNENRYEIEENKETNQDLLLFSEMWRKIL
ncbi:hypothetical protein D3C80_2209770 [compost metagenome]